MQFSLQLVLEYLLVLKQKGLAFSSVRVQLAAISAFHHSRSVFSHKMVIHFLKDLVRVFPQIKETIPPWDLTLVLSKLTDLPFEPLMTCSLLEGGLFGGHYVSQESVRDLIPHLTAPISKLLQK